MKENKTIRKGITFIVLVILEFIVPGIMIYTFDEAEYTIIATLVELLILHLYVNYNAEYLCDFFGSNENK